jgi:putative transposase
LPDYDYSSEGLYFVTICTHRRIHLFGNIADDLMILSDAGKVVDEIWAGIFRWAEDPTWIIMPNHLHGVVAISDAGEAARKPLGRMIAAFKTVSTRRIRELRVTPGRAVWQRYFYEHIIRSDRSLERILAYIQDNPFRWREDPENSAIAMRAKAI